MTPVAALLTIAAIAVVFGALVRAFEHLERRSYTGRRAGGSRRAGINSPKPQHLENQP